MTSAADMLTAGRQLLQDGEADAIGRRAVAPEVLEERARRLAMYADEPPASDPSESASPVSSPPVAVVPHPSASLAPAAPELGLTPAASRWAAANREAASKLLEWAASTHEPRVLRMVLPQVALDLPYIKLECIGQCLTFFLAVGAPAVGLEFGVDVTLEYEGKSRPAVVSLSGVATAGQFPYSRLEFLFDAT